MKTLAKILGTVGLVLIVTAPVTWYVLRDTPYATTYAVVKAGLGLAMIALWVLKGRDRGDDRAFFFYASSALIAVVLIAAGVGVNVIANKRLKTSDWTSKKIYSLAPQTVSTLKELKEPVKAIGFVDSKHPAYDALESIFKRYTAESDKFTYDFKDPRKAPDLAAKYQLKEGQTTVVLTRGAGINESHTALNVVSEQELTNALVKLNAGGQQKVYLVQGHGEWPLEGGGGDVPGQAGQNPSLSEFITSLHQEGYAVEELVLIQRQNQIPADASVLVIAKASSPFSDGEKQALEQYLEQGGRLLYFAEFSTTSGLEPLLMRYGVQIEPGMVADQLNPREPYVVTSPFFGEHEITQVLKQAKMQVQIPTARGLTPLKEGALPTLVVTPLVVTSPLAWVETKPDENPQPSDGERTGAIPVVVSITRDTKAAQNKRFDEARIVVFGDSELLVDANWGIEPNRNLVMNAVGWTTSQIQKITIRPPDRDLSTLDLSGELFSRLVFLSIDVFPTLLIAVGIAIYVSRKSR